MQSGEHAAARSCAPSTACPAPFRYRDKGIMATIGRRRRSPSCRSASILQGTLAWFAWLGLHLVYLMGFRNRAVGAAQLGVELRHLGPRRPAHLRAGQPPPTAIGDGESGSALASGGAVTGHVADEGGGVRVARDGHLRGRGGRPIGPGRPDPAVSTARFSPPTTTTTHDDGADDHDRAGPGRRRADRPVPSRAWVEHRSSAPGGSSPTGSSWRPG